MVAIYVVWPILSTIRISFFSWDGMTDPSFVGLANYVELFHASTFYTALKNNLIWLLLFLLAPPMGLAVALYLNQAVAGIRIVKSLFFAPFVLSGVVVGLIFSWFYDPTFGLLALILGHGVPVLGDARYATPGIIFVSDRPYCAERRAGRGGAHGRRARLVDALACDPAATAPHHVHGDRGHGDRGAAQLRSDFGDDGWRPVREFHRARVLHVRPGDQVLPDWLFGVDSRGAVRDHAGLYRLSPAADAAR
jgi:hypothetical protein